MSYIGNSPGVASQRVETAFTATSSQTVFTPSSGYTLGYCDVYQNGVKLVNGDDYTASDGATVTLATGAASGDSIVIVASFPRGLSDGYLKSEADAKYLTIANPSYTGTLTGGTGAITIGTNHFVKDSSGNVGIGTASPARKLSVLGGSADNVPMRVSAGTGSVDCFIDLKDPNTTADYKVRVGSTGDNLVLYAGGSERARIDSSGRLGINTLTPSYPLHVVGGSTVFRFVGSNSNEISSGVDGSGFYIEQAGGTGSTKKLRIQNSDGNNVYVGISLDGANQKQTFTTSNNTRVTIDASGYVTKPYTPMFSAYRSAGSVSGATSGNGALVTFDVADINTSGSYSTSTGRFTAPVTGTYYLSALGMLNGASASADIQLRMCKNGTAMSICNPPNPSANTQGMSFAVSAVISLSQNDYVEVYFYASNGSSTTLYASGGRFNNFSGFLIG